MVLVQENMYLLSDNLINHTMFAVYAIKLTKQTRNISFPFQLILIMCDSIHRLNFSSGRHCSFRRKLKYFHFLV